MMNRSVCLVLIALLGAAACGDDDDDDNVSSAVKKLCETQYKRFDECGFFEGASDKDKREVLDYCEKIQSDTERSCKPTQEALESCRQGYAAQTCEQVEEAVIPDACQLMCQAS